jgi:hypothetical protein
VHTVNGTMCVANCEAVGLFYDQITNSCVGCHPACAKCFGPENEDCFECNPGFVRVDATTCDTACFPENSYIQNDTCMRKIFKSKLLYNN